VLLKVLGLDDPTYVDALRADELGWVADTLGCAAGHGMRARNPLLVDARSCDGDTTPTSALEQRITAAGVTFSSRLGRT
jgi:hypothetical protein